MHTLETAAIVRYIKEYPTLWGHLRTWHYAPSDIRRYVEGFMHVSDAAIKPLIKLALDHVDWAMVSDAISMDEPEIEALLESIGE